MATIFFCLSGVCFVTGHIALGILAGCYGVALAVIADDEDDD